MPVYTALSFQVPETTTLLHFQACEVSMPCVLNNALWFVASIFVVLFLFFSVNVFF